MDRGLFRLKEPLGFDGDVTPVPKLSTSPDMAAICETADQIAQGMSFLHSRNVVHGGGTRIAFCPGKVRHSAPARLQPFKPIRVLQRRAVQLLHALVHSPPALVPPTAQFVLHWRHEHQLVSHAAQT